MRVNRLQKALAELVEEGALSTEQASLVVARAGTNAHDSSSRKALFAEVGGYLGGAFVLIATLIFVAKQFDHLSNVVLGSVFLALSAALFALALTLGAESSMRTRLTSVPAMGSAISITGSVSLFVNSGNNPPTFGFIAGSFVAGFFFYRTRNELLHLGSYGFFALTTIMITADLVSSPNDSDSMPATAIAWIVLSSIWIYFSHKNYVQETLGYVLGCGTLFLGIQILFLQNYHLISYILTIVAVVTLSRIFLLERLWPLLVGAILISTVSLGEFVAETLGGSIGAIAGLFVAGVALIASSIYASRSLQHRD